MCRYPAGESYLDVSTLATILTFGHSLVRVHTPVRFRDWAREREGEGKGKGPDPMFCANRRNTV